MPLSRGCSRVCPDARFSLRDPGVLGGQFAFLYVDLRLRDLRALTRSLPVDFATLHPLGCLCSLSRLLPRFPSGFPSRLGRVRPGFRTTPPLKTLPDLRFLPR